MLPLRIREPHTAGGSRATAGVLQTAALLHDAGKVQSGPGHPERRGDRGDAAAAVRPRTRPERRDAALLVARASPAGGDGRDRGHPRRGRPPARRRQARTARPGRRAATFSPRPTRWRPGRRPGRRGMRRSSGSSPTACWRRSPRTSEGAGAGRASGTGSGAEALRLLDSDAEPDARRLRQARPPAVPGALSRRRTWLGTRVSRPVSSAQPAQPTRESPSLRGRPIGPGA